MKIFSHSFKVRMAFLIDQEYKITILNHARKRSDKFRVGVQMNGL